MWTYTEITDLVSEPNRGMHRAKRVERKADELWRGKAGRAGISREDFSEKLKSNQGLEECIEFSKNKDCQANIIVGSGKHRAPPQWTEGR